MKSGVSPNTWGHPCCGPGGFFAAQLGRKSSGGEAPRPSDFFGTPSYHIGRGEGGGFWHVAQYSFSDINAKNGSVEPWIFIAKM